MRLKTKSNSYSNTPLIVMYYIKFTPYKLENWLLCFSITHNCSCDQSEIMPSASTLKGLNNVLFSCLFVCQYVSNNHSFG